jgi:hypothetical protein
MIKVICSSDQELHPVLCGDPLDPGDGPGSFSYTADAQGKCSINTEANSMLQLMHDRFQTIFQQ